MCNYDEMFLDKLEYNILKYETEMYHCKNPMKITYYFSLLSMLEDLFFQKTDSPISDNSNFNLKKFRQFEKINNAITYNIDKFINRRVRKFKNINKEKLESIITPLDIYFSLEDDEEEISSSETLSNKDLIFLIREFLKYSNCDINLLDKFIKDYRITTVNEKSSGYGGFYIPNYIEPNKSYIYIINSNNTYEDAIKVAHELGHDMECKKSTKSYGKFAFLSLYTEVISQYYENKFIDFLIDEKIAVKQGQSLKKDFLESIYYYLDELLYEEPTYDNIVYGYGALISFYIKDLKKDELEVFKHNLLYQKGVKYMNKVLNNDKKINRVLQKEIEKIRK